MAPSLDEERTPEVRASASRANPLETNRPDFEEKPGRSGS
jgi:hypothetical protein